LFALIYLIDYYRLREEIAKVCEERFLCYSEVEGELGYAWVEKVLQLFQITNLNHGLMMVGPSGSGKSSAWRVLLTALERFEGIEGVAHVIDPKAISKDALYGTLDPTTREWTDGLFTHILRKSVNAFLLYASNHRNSI
jgi:dynein heavy chain 1